jgi:N-sulfoglucosamine sulfohydrolase
MAPCHRSDADPAYGATVKELYAMVEPNHDRTTTMNKLVIISILLTTLFLLEVSLPTSRKAHAESPNVLVILADDCTFSDLSIYGGLNAKTPNIGQLASQGLTFNRAYVSSAMCQPCRAELFTGQFPLRNGCAWNHSACRPGTRSLPQFLKPLGYRTGIAGKVHVQPKESFPFESVRGFDQSATREPTQAHDLAGIREFMTRDESQPFCLVVALVEPHVPWVMGDRSQYPVDGIKLPPHLADTPKTREDFAAYLGEITYMDDQVGEILKSLDETGQADNTLVLFSSEQGSQFPGGKWTCWDVGLHTTLIARWPGAIVANTRTDAIVQYADIAPTLVGIAGGDASDASFAFDGSSFKAVLDGEKATHRNFAYAVHNNVPEGPPYPVRSITDGEYRYIHNLTPESLYIEKHLMGLLGGSSVHNAYWSSWMATAGENSNTLRLVQRYMHRPTHELYHTATDPAEMKNLAADPAYAKIQQQLRDELDRWLRSQSDPGILMDTSEAHAAAKRGHPIFPVKP